MACKRSCHANCVLMLLAALFVGQLSKATAHLPTPWCYVSVSPTGAVAFSQMDPTDHTHYVTVRWPDGKESTFYREGVDLTYPTWLDERRLVCVANGGPHVPAGAESSLGLIDVTHQDGDEAEFQILCKNKVSHYPPICLGKRYVAFAGNGALWLHDMKTENWRRLGPIEVESDLSRQYCFTQSPPALWWIASGKGRGYGNYGSSYEYGEPIHFSLNAVTLPDGPVRRRELVVNQKGAYWARTNLVAFPNGDSPLVGCAVITVKRSGLFGDKYKCTLVTVDRETTATQHVISVQPAPEVSYPVSTTKAGEIEIQAMETVSFGRQRCIQTMTGEGGVVVVSDGKFYLITPAGKAVELAVPWDDAEAYTRAQDGRFCFLRLRENAEILWVKPVTDR